ncbi:unnamed protein product [Haemonchus placei]|uniref:Uncharacterized protein n=1 Tax=Haemonchus placei TaxID=6290 RepID=A0A0N4VXX6_HAEPC|nr:unnamed protein product [Haemonchus placei]
MWRSSLCRSNSVASANEIFCCEAKVDPEKFVYHYYTK